MFSHEIDEQWYSPNKELAYKANAKDLAWVLARFHSLDGATVPAWTGFNQLTSTNDEETVAVGYLPLINAAAHETDTLWTAMMRCVNISNAVNPGQSTVITFDQQLYCRAKELQWANAEQCSTIFIRLGGFHIIKNFMQVIGHHMADSGIEEVWRESMVFGENTAHNNMQAKSYNRAL